MTSLHEDSAGGGTSQHEPSAASARGIESLSLHADIAQLVRARPCHGRGPEFESRYLLHARLAQLAEAPVSETGGSGFESPGEYSPGVGQRLGHLFWEQGIGGSSPSTRTCLSTNGQVTSLISRKRQFDSGQADGW